MKKRIQLPPSSTEHIAAPKQTQHPLESQLDELQRDLQNLKTQLRQSQRLAALGTAAAKLAHEFNNVITPIVGYAKYALQSNDPELMAKALRTTLKQTETVSAMTERILGLAVEAPVAFRPVSVRDVAHDTIECLCRDLSQDGINVTVDVDPDIRVWADAKQIHQVFFNLLLNACDALQGRTGRIDFHAAATDQDFIRITVADTGCGIQPDRLPTIFDAFITTKSASGKNGKRGSGLGLTVCRDIIREHRGTITVQSRPDVGSTFTITLPAAG